MADPVIKYKAKDGAYHQDIPARDLTTEDYDALTNEQRQLVRTSPIYDYVTYRDALKAPSEPEPAPEPTPDAQAPEEAT